MQKWKNGRFFSELKNQRMAMVGLTVTSVFVFIAIFNLDNYMLFI